MILIGLVAHYLIRPLAFLIFNGAKNLNGFLEVTAAITPVFGEITVDFFTSHSILVVTAPVEPWCKSDSSALNIVC